MLTLTLDPSNGPITRLEGQLDVDVAGFFQVSGGFFFEQTQDTVTLAAVGGDPAETVAVDQLRLAASHVDAFAGLNGGSAEALGLELSDVNFGLLLNSERQAAAGAAPRQWTTLVADAGGVSFTGIDGLTLSATDLVVEVNRASIGRGDRLRGRSADVQCRAGRDRDARTWTAGWAN